MTNEFMEKEIEQYPALFDQLHRIVSSLPTSQVAKLGIVINLVLPGWTPEGEMAYIRAAATIIRERIALHPDRDRILNQIADMLADFNMNVLTQDEDAERE